MPNQQSYRGNGRNDSRDEHRPMGRPNDPQFRSHGEHERDREDEHGHGRDSTWRGEGGGWRRDEGGWQGQGHQDRDDRHEGDYRRDDMMSRRDRPYERSQSMGYGRDSYGSRESMGYGRDSHGSRESMGYRGDAGSRESMGYRGDPGGYGSQGSQGYQGSERWHGDQGRYSGGGAFGMSGGMFGPRHDDDEQRSMSQRGGEMERTGMRGKGPRNFTRSDERVKEIVSEALSDDDRIDATNIEVTVRNGDVTLTGTVEDRRMKRLAEDVVEDLPGVKTVQSQLRVQAPNQGQGQGQGQQARSGEQQPETSDKRARA